MLKADDTNWALGMLAEQFESAIQVPPEPAPGQGWGQFLDAARTISQVGLYGTAAGTLVLALAGRGESRPAQQAIVLLESWWGRRGTGDYQGRRLHQTGRLAFLNLALRLSPVTTAQKLAPIVESALLRQVLPTGGWGDFYFSADLHDATPRAIPTALVLLSLTLLREPALHSAAADRAVNYLVSAMKGNPDLPEGDLVLASVAVLSAKGADADKSVRKRVSRLASSRQFRFDRTDTYHYDYGFVEASKQQFSRDYIVFPIDIFLGLTGLQNGAPGALRIRARTVADQLVGRIRRDRVFRAADNDRAASLDQAWVALLLRAASTAYAAPTWYHHIEYWLFRRRANTFADKVFPPGALLIVTFLSYTISTMPAGPFAKAISLLGATFVAALYRDSIKALFGR